MAPLILDPLLEIAGSCPRRDILAGGFLDPYLLRLDVANLTPALSCGS